MAMRKQKAQKLVKRRVKTQVVLDAGSILAPGRARDMKNPKLLLKKLLQRRKDLEKRIADLQDKIEHSRGRNRLNSQALLRIAAFRLRWYDGRIKGLRVTIAAGNEA